MKNLLFCLSSILFLQIGFAQITYEAGYFIDNTGEQVNCFIRNKVWKSNPTTFKYKLLEGSPEQIGTIQKVQEFGISNRFKYVRKDVMVDRSSTNPDKLSLQADPELNQERHFLKVLVGGEKTLYAFVEGSRSRYFIEVEGNGVEQLIYKKYLAYAEVEVGEAAYRKYGQQLDSVQKVFINNYFRQQLYDHVRCDYTTLGNVNTLSYGQRSLVKYFLKHASCDGSPLTDYTIKTEKTDWFNFTPRIGYNQSSVEVESVSFPLRNVDFGDKISIRYSVELEFILPYNQGKWAIFFEPTYQTYSGTGTAQYSINPVNTILDQEASIDYNSFSMPIGVRYYQYISEKSKLFGNASFNGFLFGGINAEQELEFEVSENVEIDARNYFAVGIGYKYANKISLEGRYVFTHDILSNELAYNGKHRISSIILGYTIF